ncbi:hypothetical protein E8E13_007289 [Curvularia kusanoi]|uniref:Uncharacterized protein n=1 Tax=Curvularia kusanoi TaxID=90978 RepID=A0A9P4TEX2_CURKU|nr:hypothetical protein E8E13_007289 [Curvularia kusanoi]
MYRHNPFNQSRQAKDCLARQFKYYLSAWYEEAEIPRDWAIAVSDNGWTNNELGVE